MFCVEEVMMNTLERTLEYLDQNGVYYARSSHPITYTAREVAAVEHVSPHKIAKTVLFLCEQGYGMAVVPADTFVDFESLRTTMGVDTVRLATEQELGELFPESELGAMPPFGNLFGLTLYFDASLVDEKFIGFNGGTHRDLIHMRVADFLRLAQPVIGGFAVHPSLAAVR
jgi:Ala-tRNA(Pro) deacylase